MFFVFRLLIKMLPLTKASVTGSAFVAALVSVPVAALSFVGLYALGGTSDVSIAKVAGAMVGVHVLIGIGEAFITALTVGADPASCVILETRRLAVPSWRSCLPCPHPCSRGSSRTRRPTPGRSAAASRSEGSPPARSSRLNRTMTSPRLVTFFRSAATIPPTVHVSPGDRVVRCNSVDAQERRHHNQSVAQAAKSRRT